MKNWGLILAATDISLLCLDFDGVVLESNSIRDAAWSGIFPDHPEETRNAIIAFHRANPGIDRATKLRRIYIELFGQIPEDEQMTKQLALFRRYCEEALISAPFVPGVIPFLESLKIPVAVITAAREDEVASICNRRGLDKYFSIRGGPVNKKQHLQQLMTAHKLQANEILMVGDQLTDRDAAESVGCHFVGRIAPDRPAPFGAEVTTINDLRMGWDGLSALLPNRSV